MEQWDDMEIQRPETGGPKSRMRWVLWGGAAVLAFAIGFYVYFRSQRPEAVQRPQPEAGQSAVPGSSEPLAPAEETEAALELPALDESDDLVRELTGALSSQPELAKWLVGGNLIRTFVAIVDNIAEGVSPTRHLKPLRPDEPFRAVRSSGGYFVDPRSYERYNLVADVVASVDTEGAANLYRNLKPLVQQAYQELGYPDRSFEPTLALAIHRLLSTPVLEGDVELDATTVAYRYSDPALERLSPAQKHLMRMGPRNVRKIQGQLQALRTALRLPAVQSP